MDSVALSPDHYQFLRLYPGLKHCEVQRSAWTWTSPESHFKDLTDSVTALSKRLQRVLDLGEDPKPSVSRSQSKVQSLLQHVQLSSREDFLKYSTEILLDPNTAHTELALSDGERRVTYQGISFIYPEHSDRFSDWRQVLSRQALTGRCYVEVEWSSKEQLSVSLSYSQIQRKGRSIKNLFGHNDHSWALYCDQNKYSYWFNGEETKVCGPVTRRIGVYLDHGAGAVTFYSVKDQSMNLLHRVQTSFSQPLLLGFGLFGVFTGATAALPTLGGELRA
ncbi:hypothetical protein NL108_016992 [Boleophthalmus pectinirostris]|nr:hypothetical protein NL108_016992 [Boleophthalmus pectinirostris]